MHRRSVDADKQPGALQQCSELAPSQRTGSAIYFSRGDGGESARERGFWFGGPGAEENLIELRCEPANEFDPAFIRPGL